MMGQIETELSVLDHYHYCSQHQPKRMACSTYGMATTDFPTSQATSPLH